MHVLLTETTSKTEVILKRVSEMLELRTHQGKVKSWQISGEDEVEISKYKL